MLAGGLTCEPLTMEILKSELSNCDRFDLKILGVPPVQGAIILATELAAKEKMKGENS